VTFALEYGVTGSPVLNKEDSRVQQVREREREREGKSTSSDF
jgi:hypothetical protein